MPAEERRARDRAAQRRLIVATARRLAEGKGWDAVTTRRLSEEIEYSQPVLYKHFSGMDEIAAAVAVDGFAELADALAKARASARTPRERLRRLACAYIDFARNSPALYDAMFTRSTTLQFAVTKTPSELQTAFAELREVMAEIADDQDADTLTEVLWAALHGLATLARSGRLRPGVDSDRVELLVGQLSSGK